jgi:glycosyltransferase involved in cell wall biosynthesis
MIAIIVPVHNEEKTLAACLDALLLAASHPQIVCTDVQIIVVLDSCSDASHTIASSRGVVVITVDVQNVGAARAAGSALAINSGATWLAHTDADTIVASDWLWRQRSLGTEVVCGTVGVDDWSDHGEADQLLAAHFAATYTDADGHRHIHGANLGVSVNAYLRAGGFRSLSCSEDVALVNSLIATGATFSWSAAPRVITSARGKGRASGGFADTLTAVVRRALGREPCSRST